jgi:hypothetical protein
MVDLTNLSKGVHLVIISAVSYALTAVKEKEKVGKEEWAGARNRVIFSSKRRKEMLKVETV